MKCDANTFAQMYKDVYRDLYRFALCMMKNPQDAEDAVSDAVMSAFENIEKLRDKKAFRSWIFTITANTCKKKLKELSKKKQVSTEEVDIHISSADNDYGIAIDVRKAFFILSEEEQMIVGLSVFGGYNSNEIGKMLSLKANTVRSKRSRALEKMECILK
ncbi:MAG: RNA polymerase sigma factor [Dorea sp.]